MTNRAGDHGELDFPFRLNRSLPFPSKAYSPRRPVANLLGMSAMPPIWEIVAFGLPRVYFNLAVFDAGNSALDRHNLLSSTSLSAPKPRMSKRRNCQPARPHNATVPKIQKV